MTKSIRKFLLLVLFLFPARAFCEPAAIILSFTGSVDFRAAKDAEWKNAVKGAQIPDSGSVRTGKESRAALFFKNNTTVWLKENTTLEIQSKNIIDNTISLNTGSIKVRVPHLRFREKFSIRSRTALAAVRGTIFTADANESGDLSSLNVLFGEVKLDIDNKKSSLISQGNGFADGKVLLLSRESELMGLEDWSPATQDSERRAILKDNENKRNEIRQFAVQTNAAEREVAAGRDQIKEEDFAAGRTLTDVHGNLVRVDQRLDRPDNKTIQVINVVKRTSYSSGGLRQYAYNGTSSARFDSLIAKVTFNSALPDQINQFPGFFQQNDKTLKLDNAELIVANTTEDGSVFTIGFFGKRNPNSNSDDINSDLYVGTLSADATQTGQKKLFNLKLNSDLSVTGLTHFTEDTTIKSIESPDSTSGELYHYNANRWVDAANVNSKIWLTSENFVINNSGKIRNISDFTNGSSDFESLLKNSAGEVAIFAKQDVNNSPSNIDATNFLGGNATKKNIDLVIIPDLILSVIKSLATSGDALKTAY